MNIWSICGKQYFLPLQYLHLWVNARANLPCDYSFLFLVYVLSLADLEAESSATYTLLKLYLVFLQEIVSVLMCLF